MHEELLPTVFVYPPYPGRFQGVIQVLGGVQLDVLRAYPGRCRDRWGLGGSPRASFPGLVGGAVGGARDVAPSFGRSVLGCIETNVCK